MPEFIKHVGQINKTGKKCVVVFREIPGEENSCLVVETENLPDLYHDDIIGAVESPSAQVDIDFYKFAQRSTFHDGVNMLEGLHIKGLLKKFPSMEITMIPTREYSILLSDLNNQLKQLNSEGKTTSSDINTDGGTTSEINNTGTLSDQQIADQMRSQAAYFKKEAERLLKEANSLDPIEQKQVEELKENKSKRTYTKKK